MLHEHWKKEDATVIEKKLQTITVQLPNGEKRREGFFSTVGAKKIKHYSVGDTVEVIVNADAHDHHSKNPQIVKIIFPEA